MQANKYTKVQTKQYTEMNRCSELQLSYIEIQVQYMLKFGTENQVAVLSFGTVNK